MVVVAAVVLMVKVMVMVVMVVMNGRSSSSIGGGGVWAKLSFYPFLVSRFIDGLEALSRIIKITKVSQE